MTTPILSDEWLTPDERIARDNERRWQSILHCRSQLQNPETAIERKQRGKQLQQATIERENNHRQTPIPAPQQQTAPQLPDPAPTIRLSDGITHDIVDTDDHLSPTPAPTPPPLILEPSICPSRTCKAPQYYTNDGGADSKWKTDQVRGMAAILKHSNFVPSDWADIEDILSDLDHEETIHHYAPHTMAAFKHTTKDPDLPNYFDGMHSDNAEDYHDAIKGEVEAFTEYATWELVDRSSVCSTASIIPGTWAFRCKRRPDGSFQKFKARYCVRGDIAKRNATEQEEDTY